jgi:hypothetical protein
MECEHSAIATVLLDWLIPPIHLLLWAFIAIMYSYGEKIKAPPGGLISAHSMCLLVVQGITSVYTPETAW